MTGPIVFAAIQVFLFGITNAQCPVQCNDAKIITGNQECGSPPIDCDGTWHLKDPESPQCPQFWNGWVDVCLYRRNKDGVYMCFCDPGNITYTSGSDWQLGLCFDNRVTPKLLTFIGTISDNSYAKCMAKCIADNSDYTYFGMEDGNECFCGNTEPPIVDHGQVIQTQCDTPCPGADKTTCGGDNMIQVYAIPKRSPAWLGGGCYDNGITTSWGTHIGDFPVENQYFYCMEKCATNTPAYTYFGMEDGTKCYCGNIPPPAVTHPQVLQSECTKPCPGSPKTTCGGTKKIQVYAVQEGR